jgi:hypothetical protein
LRAIIVPPKRQNWVAIEVICIFSDIATKAWSLREKQKAPDKAWSETLAKCAGKFKRFL